MDDKKYLESFGERVHSHRKALKMTQKDLAKKLGTKYPMIVRIEHGEVNCRLNTVRKIAQELGVSMAELVGIE